MHGTCYDLNSSGLKAEHSFFAGRGCRAAGPAAGAIRSPWRLSQAPYKTGMPARTRYALHRDHFPNAVPIHALAVSGRYNLSAIHHQILICQRSSKIVILFHQ